MAQQVIQLDRKLSCSVCLDLLKDPVTIPCGHSYCMICIINCWDKENEKGEGAHSCPQCRQTFTLRPALVKNTMLAELVEELKKVNPQPASPHLSYAGALSVACDYCTGKKQRALKSCLVCMASFCEQHLQPHYNVALLKKHKLVEATFKLQENICSRHDEVMKIFCRTDQQSICYLCSMDEHKGHDTVSAAAERAERQTELGVSRKKIQRRIQERERDVKVIQQRVDAFNLSADEAVRDSEKIFTEMMSKVKQQIRSQQKTQADKAKELEVKLQQEITDLRKKDTKLEQLAHTEDHLLFLKNYPSLSDVSVSKNSQRMDDCPLSSFKDLTAAVSEVKDKLQAVLRRSVGLGGERGLSKKGSRLHRSDNDIIPMFTCEDLPKEYSAEAEVEVLPAAAEPSGMKQRGNPHQFKLDQNRDDEFGEHYKVFQKQLRKCDKFRKFGLLD
uniref:E3 ubiquitin/ISG15 ligase TRIM25-like n=1 Tax=Semicossyphus pulcher TaxID=241346 RepID=UPI0037E95C47